MENNINRITMLKKTFDDYKHVDKNGVEYWEARELSKAMGYTDFRNFKNAIDRAKEQMKSTGKDPNSHIVEFNEKAKIGLDKDREIINYNLSKLAAYDVAMNADPKKPEVAFAQEYFLQSTAKAEVLQQRMDDKKYIEARTQLSGANKELSSTLVSHDVKSTEIGIVLSAGDEGMFDMSTQELKDALNIPKSKPVADMLGAKMAAYKTIAQYNSEQRIVQQDARGVDDTSDICYNENRIIREMVQDRYGDSPENLITGEDIKKVEKRYNKQMKVLEKALEESPELRKYAEENF